MFARSSALRRVVQFNWSRQDVLTLQLGDGRLRLVLLSEPQKPVAFGHLGDRVVNYLRLIDSRKLLLHEGHQHGVVHIGVEVPYVNLEVSLWLASSLSGFLLERFLLLVALNCTILLRLSVGAVAGPIKLETARGPRDIGSI